MVSLALATAVGLTTTAPVAAADESDGEAVQADAQAHHVEAGAGERDKPDAVHGEADPGHSEHDPTDLTHANASAMLHDPTELRFDMAICTLVVFLMLLIVLRIYAWKPIMQGLDQRALSIAAQIEQAEQKAEEADAVLREHRAKLTAAGEEAQGIIAQARKDAEVVAERIREEAKADAARQRERALADIKSAKNNAVREMARQGADLAVSLAGRIVQRELKSEDHASLITEALERFPSKN